MPKIPYLSFPNVAAFMLAFDKCTLDHFLQDSVTGWISHLDFANTAFDFISITVKKSLVTSFTVNMAFITLQNLLKWNFNANGAFHMHSRRVP